jgi:hypothetical protein
MAPIRCRWHTDDGRCLGYKVHHNKDKPDLCQRHIDALSPWIKAQAWELADSWLAVFGKTGKGAKLSPEDRKTLLGLLRAEDQA